MLKYDIEENKEYGVSGSIVRGLGLPSNFMYINSELNFGPIWVREEDWVKDIKWACSNGVELFAMLPQMDCSRKHVIIDDAGNCFSTKIAWKTTKRLQAAPFIVRVTLGDSCHREELKMRMEGGGASSFMFGKFVLYRREFEEQTREPLHKDAGEGMKTQALPYCGFDEGRYKGTAKTIYEEQNLVTADQEKLTEEVTNKIERNLICLGATAVVGELQSWGHSCIEKLAYAGIKVWVLTRDNMETTINVGLC